jgi:hypothetical protein
MTITHESGDIFWCAGAMQSMSDESRGISIETGRQKARAALYGFESKKVFENPEVNRTGEGTIVE